MEVSGRQSHGLGVKYGSRFWTASGIRVTSQLRDFWRDFRLPLLESIRMSRPEPDF